MRLAAHDDGGTLTRSDGCWQWKRNDASWMTAQRGRRMSMMWIVGKLEKKQHWQQLHRRLDALVAVADGDDGDGVLKMEELFV